MNRRVSWTTGVRRRVGDPLVPFAVLVASGLAFPVMTWAVLGGLAGYTLSGSV
jgi:hypothetical protein